MFNIRQGEISDLEDIFLVEKACFAHPWSMQALKDSMNTDNTVFFVCTDEDSGIIGYMSLMRIMDEAELLNIAVLPKYRGRGIGTMLLDRLFRFCTAHNIGRIMLEVRKSNNCAISLYNKYGFLKDSVRKDYYDNPKEDAVLMSVSLNEG
jgi:ribosomal-protein-alanine N-acetyltransferase